MNKLLFLIILLLILVFMFCFIGKVENKENIQYGIIFSQKQSKNLGLDWKENYLAILNELKPDNIKITAHWDLIERSNNIYSFKDLDWQIEQAKDINVLLYINVCDSPDWFNNEKEILSFLNTIIFRYQDKVIMWEISDQCFEDFHNQELDLAKTLSDKPIILSNIGDINKFVLTRKMFIPWIKVYIPNPLRPIFYNRVSFFNTKETIITELLGQPLGLIDLEQMTRQEQDKSVNFNLIKRNISFAKNTGFNTVYIKGGEWWYLLKTRYKESEIWDFVEKVLTE